MSLFKKVEEVKSGVKVLGYGKTGKTLFALSFPEGCAIDAEDGMAFYKGKYPNLKYILNSTSADEIRECRSIDFDGRRATQNARVVDGHIVKQGEQIQIGGNESYVAVTRKNYKLDRLK